MTGFLLDTNVPSELVRTRPEPLVTAWVYAQPEETLFLSTITIGELYQGASLLTAGKRRAQLEHWLQHDLVPRFATRILPVTHAVAQRWGVIAAQRRRAGEPLAVADGLIAATALEHGLTVVTRNVIDFRNLPVNLLNPWEPHA